MKLQDRIKFLFTNQSKPKGDRGKTTLIDPQKPQNFLRRIRPDAKGIYKFQELDPKKLENETVENLLNILFENSDTISYAINIMITMANKGYELVYDKDNEAGRDIIQSFIDRIETSGTSMKSRINEQILFRQLKGATSLELSYDAETGEIPSALDAVCPWTYEFQKRNDPTLGEYYVLQQRIKGTWEDIFDPTKPNDTIFYETVLKKEKKPFPSPPMASAIYGTLFMLRIYELSSSYLAGQAATRGIASIDRKPLADASYLPEQIDSIVDDARKKITEALSTGDISQLAVVDVDVAYQALTALGKADLDGLEVVLNQQDRSIQRATKTPRLLYGTARSTPFGDAEGRVEWEVYENQIGDVVDDIEYIFSKVFRSILRRAGNTGEVRLKLNQAVNTEAERIRNEAFNIDIQGLEKAYNMGLFSREELRRYLIEKYSKFKDFDPELPEGLEPPMRQQLIGVQQTDAEE